MNDHDPDSIFDSDFDDRQQASAMGWTPDAKAERRHQRLADQGTAILRRNGFPYLEDPNRTDGVHSKVTIRAAVETGLPLEFDGTHYDRQGHSDNLHDIKRSALSDDLYEGERLVYTAQQKRRSLIERYGCFARLLKPRHGRTDKIAHVRMWLRNLTRIDGDARDAIAANIDAHLCDLGASFKRRSDLLSGAMRCKVSTTRARIVNGRNVLREAIRQAQSDDDQSHRKTSKTEIESLMEEINALLPHERELVVRKLVELAAVSEIDATNKADRASRISMIPHSILEKLDALGLNDDETRRMLARKSPSEQKRWCADKINEAISGSTEQRKAARARCNSEQWKRLIQEFVAAVKAQRRAQQVTAKEAA